MTLSAIAISLLAATISGRVIVPDGSVLPGCTVTITSGNWTEKTFTNAQGAYRLDLPRGEYQITFELAGYGKATHVIDVGREDLRLGDDKITPDQTVEELTLDKPCGSAPQTRLDDPTCDDFDFDVKLIEVAAHDDSALDLLRQRYDAALSSPERQMIAKTLIAHHHADAAVWDDLIADAENAVRFAADGDDKPNRDLAPWCKEHGYEPNAYYRVAGGALATVSVDPRSHDLLMKALETNDFWMLYTAVSGLGAQHDESALDTIAKTLERIDHAAEVAQALASFKSEAADRLAFRYIDPENDDYREMRNRN